MEGQNVTYIIIRIFNVDFNYSLKVYFFNNVKSQNRKTFSINKF